MSGWANRLAVALTVAGVVVGGGHPAAQVQVDGPRGYGSVIGLPSKDTAAGDGDPEYGAYLAAECATCHRSDGSSDAGLPRIAGWPTDQFSDVLEDYRSGARQHPVMQIIAKRLGDNEIAALAAYFATQQ